MNAQKIWLDSSVLQRRVHMDCYQAGNKPRYLLVLFGGSGIDEVEYAARGRSIHPGFQQTVQDAEAAGVAAVLLYVTAPYDVPSARFAELPAAVESWNHHVLSELLARWSTWPMFVSSFSGGAALAFHGVHAVPQCLGGAALGVDQFPRSFSPPSHWQTKLHFICGRDDPVCNHPSNRTLIEQLELRGDAEIDYLPRGRHQLSDYVAQGALYRLLADYDKLLRA